MSARRRQETLERFSVPLEEDRGLPADIPFPLKRTRRPSAHADDDTDLSFGGSDNADADFSDDPDDEVFSSKKAKGKGKDKVTSRNKKHNSSSAHENPKVMLISLKGEIRLLIDAHVRLTSFLPAGALGLNLTVANNVYL